MVYYYINGELYHHGTKGMKWGKRLYQNKDGSLTPLGRIRYRTNKDFKGRVDKQRALEKARAAKAAKKQHEEDRERVLKSGTAAEVLKYKGELTQQEMDAAYKRLQWEQNVKGIAEKDVVVGKSKVDTMMEKMGKMTEHAQSLAKTYNMVANVFNAFSDNIMLPKVDTNITSGNKDQVKAHKKEQKKAEEAKQKRAEQEAQRETKQKERAEKREKEAAEKIAAEQKAKEKKTNSDDGWTVEGKGRFDSDSFKRGEEVIIDVDFEDVPTSRSSSEYQVGRSVVSGLLNGPSNLLEDKRGRN